MSAPQSPVDREQQAIAKALRLRGAPAPVARVSRKALIVAGAVLSAGLAGAIGWSLTEHPKRPPPQAAPQSPPPLERISTLPKDYLQRGAPPTLGPPQRVQTRHLERPARFEMPPPPEHTWPDPVRLVPAPDRDSLWDQRRAGRQPWLPRWRKRQL